MESGVCIHIRVGDTYEEAGYFGRACTARVDIQVNCKNTIDDRGGQDGEC